MTRHPDDIVTSTPACLRCARADRATCECAERRDAVVLVDVALRPDAAVWAPPVVEPDARYHRQMAADVAAERDDLRRRLAAMHERAQWAEAVASEAMRVGLEEIEFLHYRAELASYDPPARYLQRVALHHRRRADDAETERDSYKRIVDAAMERGRRLHRRAQAAERAARVADGATRDVRRNAWFANLAAFAHAIRVRNERDAARAERDDARALGEQAMTEGLACIGHLRAWMEQDQRHWEAFLGEHRDAERARDAARAQHAALAAKARALVGALGCSTCEEPAEVRADDGDDYCLACCAKHDIPPRNYTRLDHGAEAVALAALLGDGAGAGGAGTAERGEGR
jgi:hypothetical protein